jgi:hypothetical protein
MAEYDIGDVVRLYTSTPFTDNDSGETFDPDVVNFKVLAPGATESTTYVYGTDAEVVYDSIGAYHMLVRPAVAGKWLWRVEGFTDTLAMGAEEGSFTVKPQLVQ